MQEFLEWVTGQLKASTSPSAGRTQGAVVEDWVDSYLTYIGEDKEEEDKDEKDNGEAAKHKQGEKNKGSAESKVCVLALHPE